MDPNMHTACFNIIWEDLDNKVDPLRNNYKKLIPGAASCTKTMKTKLTISEIIIKKLIPRATSCRKTMRTKLTL